MPGAQAIHWKWLHFSIPGPTFSKKPDWGSNIGQANKLHSSTTYVSALASWFISCLSSFLDFICYPQAERITPINPFLPTLLFSQLHIGTLGGSHERLLELSLEMGPNLGHSLAFLSLCLLWNFCLLFIMIRWALKEGIYRELQFRNSF